MKLVERRIINGKTAWAVNGRDQTTFHRTRDEARKAAGLKPARKVTLDKAITESETGDVTEFRP